MHTLALTADELVERLLWPSAADPVCILDSCGTNRKGERLLIAGASPAKVIIESSAPEALAGLEKLIQEYPAVFFTVSYDLGLRMNGIRSRHPESEEPFIWASAFESIFVHNYESGGTTAEGPGSTPELPANPSSRGPTAARLPVQVKAASSEISHSEYLKRIDEIQELIRAGETYQTNLTQKIRAELPGLHSGRLLFNTLRRRHPSTYSAYFSRGFDEVVSISPERFFRLTDLSETGAGGRIKASPIKGTRPRGTDPVSDIRLRQELASSEKDRAENTMIVDLLRNDLGRVCRFGSVRVSDLCSVEDLPSLFHLVSTIEGTLSKGIRFGDILRALFPCGSITGCPKHRTMQIIDELEPSSRGLSMGAIGYAFRTSDLPGLAGLFGSSHTGEPGYVCSDLSVAIRTAVVRNGFAAFNVGGGVVIDSEREAEYRESLDKAAALLDAIGTRLADDEGS